MSYMTARCINMITSGMLQKLSPLLNFEKNIFNDFWLKTKLFSKLAGDLLFWQNVCHQKVR